MAKQTIRSMVTLGVVSAMLGGTHAATQGEPDPGVAFTRLIDRAEMRISRVVLQPGATRSPHAHTDVEYHAWVPIEGSLELSVQTAEPVAAAVGEAFFFERGTMHGFSNVGTVEAAVLEVFVKDSDATASRDAMDWDALHVRLLALLGPTSRARSAPW